MGDNPHLPGTRDKFIEENIRLVHHIAHKFAPLLKRLSSLIEYEDLVSIGSMGLVKAYDKFDPTGYEEAPKFSTYAFPMIQGEILRFLRDTDQGVHFSRGHKDAYSKIRRAGMLEEDPQFIADKLGITLKEVNSGLEVHVHSTVSLESTKFHSDGQDITIGDGIPSEEVDLDNKLIVQEFLSTLTEKERSILLLSVDGKTQLEVGKLLGTTQVQVSRILKKVYDKAKKYGESSIIENNKKEEVVNMSARGSYKPQVLEARKLLADSKMSLTEISKATGVARSTVFLHSKELRNPKNNMPEVKQVLPKEEVKELIDQKSVEKSDNQVSKETPSTIKLDSDTVEQTLQGGQDVPARNAGVTLNVENIDLDQAYAEFKKVICALKFLNVKKISLSIKTEGE